MAANNTLAVKYFGQKGLYGIKNLNGNSIPEELNQFWTHKHMAEAALVSHVEKLRKELEEKQNGSGKRNKTVQSVREGTDN